MAILPNYWSGNQFVIPGLPANGLLNQPQSSALQIAGVPQQQVGILPGLINTQPGEGSPNTDTGTANPAAGQSIGIGIGPASGTPGTGGIGGLMGAIATIAAPTIANAAVKAATGKSIGEHAMGMVNGPAESGTVGGVSGMGMGVGTGVTAGPNSTAVNMGISANPEASVSVGAGPGTGVSAPGNTSVNMGISADPEASVSVGDGGTGGSAGSKVICTLLHSRGIISDEIYAADAEYGRMAHPDVVAGYHFWAVPYVRIAGNSGLVASWAFGLAKLLAVPWANEMAYRKGVISKGSRLGAFFITFGVPVCGFIGKLINASRAAAAIKA